MNGAGGYEEAMSPVVLLLSIPGTLVLLAAVLVLSAMAEERFLSPRSLVISVVRTRNNTPEYAEAFVARQLEQLLADQTRTSRPPATRPAAS